MHKYMSVNLDSLEIAEDEDEDANQLTISQDRDILRSKSQVLQQ